VLCHVAARLSGSESKAVQELDPATSKEDGPVASSLNRTKRWLLSHSQHLNFFSILILASVGLLSSILCYQVLQCGYFTPVIYDIWLCVFTIDLFCTFGSCASFSSTFKSCLDKMTPTNKRMEHSLYISCHKFL
jgi:hypothetical protein